MIFPCIEIGFLLADGIQYRNRKYFICYSLSFSEEWDILQIEDGRGKAILFYYIQSGSDSASVEYIAGIQYREGHRFAPFIFQLFKQIGR